MSTPSLAIRSKDPLRSRAREGTAVTVGRQRQRARSFPEYPAAKIDGRHAPLPEAVHASAIQSEIPVIREKCLGRRVVLVAGHDEPMHRPPESAPGRQQFLGEHLEERLVPDRRDRKGAFRPVVAEASPLAAGHGESRHRPRGESVLSPAALASGPFPRVTPLAPGGPRREPASVRRGPRRLRRSSPPARAVQTL